MRAFSATISEDSLSSVYDSITEDRDSSGTVGIVDIKKACTAIGVGYRAAHFIPTESWQCDACGYEFRYHPCPSDDDKIDRNIHDVCPMCGFQVGWSKLSAMTRAHKMPEHWYDKLIAEYSGAFGPKIAAHVAKKGALTLQRGGLYWARSAAENERTDAKKINVEAKIVEIDRAKKFEKTTPKPDPAPVVEYAEPGELGIF